MANQIKRLITTLTLLLAVSLLSVAAIGQQASRTSEAESSAVTASGFQAPPSFEKRPQRVPTRAAAPVAFSNNVDQEWLPANQRSSAATSPAYPSQPNQLIQNTAVQQASFTTPTVHSSIETASIANNTATARKGIPLKPPSKDVQDLAPSRSSSSWTSIISMVFSLILVIGIFLGLSWIFRKTSPSAGSMLPKEVVEIIGRTPMANRQQLYVIRFGRKLVLVSQQVGQTEVLSEIDDRTEVDHLLGLCEQNNSRNVSTSFRNVLQQVASSTESKWSIRQRRSTPRTSSLDTLS
jgi:flagellar protein FliO/FliZ